MSSLERGLAFVEGYMTDQAASHRFVGLHKEVAHELCDKIEVAGFGKVLGLFGSGEFYRLLKFEPDGSFRSVRNEEILRHKRSLLEEDMDKYSQVKNLPDVDFLVIVDTTNISGNSASLASLRNFRLLYCDVDKVVDGFPEIFPYDVGIIDSRVFNKTLGKLSSVIDDLSINLDEILLVRPDNPRAQTRYVESWLQGFLLTVSVPLIWCDSTTESRYCEAVKCFAEKIGAARWYEFLMTCSDMWRPYYSKIYGEASMKDIIEARFQMFLNGKGLKLNER